jgi:hypothetical protein
LITGSSQLHTYIQKEKGKNESWCLITCVVAGCLYAK